MIYRFIENLARLIMEWAIRHQSPTRSIIDDISDAFDNKRLTPKG